VKAALGQEFIDWLVSADGQQTIAGYKINGQQLFFPTPRSGSVNVQAFCRAGNAKRVRLTLDHRHGISAQAAEVLLHAAGSLRGALAE